MGAKPIEVKRTVGKLRSNVRRNQALLSRRMFQIPCAGGRETKTVLTTRLMWEVTAQPMCIIRNLYKSPILPPERNNIKPIPPKDEAITHSCLADPRRKYRPGLEVCEGGVIQIVKEWLINQ